MRKQIVENLNLQAPINTTLQNAINTIQTLKACTLQKNRPTFLPACEYSRNMTSINYLELLQINAFFAEKGKHNQQSLKINKSFIDKGNYLIDSTFALQHNFYCMRDKYSGSNSVTKIPTQMEVNLYYMIPKLIYYISNKIELFDEAVFASKFSEVEMIRMFDILASLVYDCKRQDELYELEEYFCRDEVLKSFLDNLRQASKRQLDISISPLVKQGRPYLIKGDGIKYYNILTGYLHMFLSPFLAGFINLAKKNTQCMNVKSLCDYRIIIETTDVDAIDVMFNIQAYGHQPISLSPKIFVKFERLIALGAIKKEDTECL